MSDTRNTLDDGWYWATLARKDLENVKVHLKTKINELAAMTAERDALKAELAAAREERDKLLEALSSIVIDLRDPEHRPGDWSEQVVIRKAQAAITAATAFTIRERAEMVNAARDKP